MAELTAIRTDRVETPAAAPQKVTYLTLTVHLTANDDGHESLRSSLTKFEPVVARTDGVEMPWIWAVLATEVRSHLPRYENDEQFSMVLSPVVVTMPTESTPGVGLSGDF
ncbi:MAG: hypothetical protein H0T42_17900 [Deltaproteobacteria bacterium]|nr:hypothetical protein [Deltaproteobacteria bacterium]